MRNTILVRIIGLAVVLASLACVFVTAAAAQDSRRIASDLIEQGWQYDFSLIRELEAKYQAGRAKFPQDADLAMAMGLIHAKYSRYADAQGDLANYRKLRANDPNSIRMHAWLSLTLRELEVALSDAEALSQNLPAKGGQATAGGAIQEDESTAFTREAFIRFLGAEFGYLMGPMETFIPQLQVSAVRVNVLEHLSDDETKVFLDAEAAVEKQFTLLLLERDQLMDETRLAKEGFNVQETKRLLQEREQITADRAALETKEAEFAAQRDASLAELNKRRNEIETTGVELRAVSDDLKTQIVALEGDIARLFRLADRSSDPILARRYRLDAEGLLRLQDARRFDLRTVEGSLAATNAELRTLRGQQKNVVTQYQAATKQIKKDLGKLNLRNNRISRDMKKLARPATGNSARVNSLTRRAQSFSTYLSLPLEEMKERFSRRLTAGG
ncbi:MAG: hypothetical protein MPJ50_02965 [Pirellulales bacterium]|nr:hypothetical protein [Pirellulales bacterium]